MFVSNSHRNVKCVKYGYRMVELALNNQREHKVLDITAQLTLCNTKKCNVET